LPLLSFAFRVFSISKWDRILKAFTMRYRDLRFKGTQSCILQREHCCRSIGPRVVDKQIVQHCKSLEPMPTGVRTAIAQMMPIEFTNPSPQPIGFPDVDYALVVKPECRKEVSD